MKKEAKQKIQKEIKPYVQKDSQSLNKPAFQDQNKQSTLPDIGQASSLPDIFGSQLQKPQKANDFGFEDINIENIDMD